jgi:hypothetical protein
MTRRQFNLLAFGEYDHRVSTIRRAVESFGGTMREFYCGRWDRTDGGVAVMESISGGKERPKYNRPRRSPA